MQNEERWFDIARGAIERHLGDVCGEEGGEPNADLLYDHAFVLAHDALIDSGLSPEVATRIASQCARDIAQP